jgi:hypothetical protein
MMATTEAAVRVGGHERERIGKWACNSIVEEGCCDSDEAPEGPLLPRGDQEAGLALVTNRRSRRREGDPATGALAAPSHRPGGRRAAALAERGANARQRQQARLAEIGARQRTARAATGKDEVEQHALNARRKGVTCL